MRQIRSSAAPSDRPRLKSQCWIKIIEKIEKKISSINYEKINNLLNNKVIPKPIPKVKQVINTPENKKITTNKEMVKLTFPGKKNRRSGDNTMSFGRKINK